MVIEYTQLWQTWSLVRPVVATTPSTVRHERGNPLVRPDELRMLVQKARVEQRWSVAALAARCECDVETLAAFERGDEVIHPSIQARLKAVLRL